MSRILIVGAGGFGRELFWWLRSHDNPRWREGFAGFLDDNVHALDGFADYPPGVVDSISQYQPHGGDELVMAIANPAAKLRIADQLRKRGAVWATFVHSRTTVVPNARIGVGSVLCPLAGLSCDVRIGEFATLNCYAGVGHDGLLGDGCTLSAHAEVMGQAVVGTGVFLGSHASVLPGVRVGDFAKIGAGSVATRNVRPETTMVGVPAKRLDFPPAPAKAA